MLIAQFSAKKLQGRLSIGLVMNDCLRVIAMSGEAVARTGEFCSRLASYAGKGIGGARYIASSNHLISFSLVVGVGVNVPVQVLVNGYDYTVGDTVHCAIVHDELNFITPY